jgi:hypothetical protein
MTVTAIPTMLLDPSREAALQRLEWLTWFTDNAIRIPGTSRTFGADAALSIVPGAGSLVGTGISAYVVFEALRMGVPMRKLARMGGNIALDTVVGAVPLAGFFFDLAFKANQRNLTILISHLEEQSS